MIRVLLVDDVADVRAYVREELSHDAGIEVVGEASNGQEAIDLVAKLRPQVVIMDVKMPGMGGIEATEAIFIKNPSTAVVMLSVHDDPETLRQAMRVGAKDFLIKPSSREELIGTVRRVAAMEVLKVVPDANKVIDGKVILIAAGKGGVGKTTMSCNLAVTLAKEKHAKVALIDLDTQFGDVGVMLNLRSPKNISDLFTEASELDEQNILDTMVEGPAGIQVLLAPVDSVMAELVTPEMIRDLVGKLVKHFDFVIADSGAHFSDASLEGVELAYKIVVVTSTTVVSLKDARQALTVLNQLGIEEDKIALVVNRSVGHSHFSKESISENLKTPVTMELPYDPELVEGAMMAGTPFVVSHPQAALSKAYKELVSKVVPADFVGNAERTVVTQKPGKKGFFGRRG